MKKLFVLSAFFFVFAFAFAQPGNNLCTTPTNLTPQTTCGATTNQTVQNATNVGSPTNPAGTTRDVWYTFTTPANIRNVVITANGFGANLNNTNTFIEAFNAGACAADVFTGTSIGTTPSGGARTLALTNLSPSTQYWFRVFTTGTATGGTAANWGFSICVSYTAVPGNDNCAGATVLTPGTLNTSGTVLNATASGTPVGCATGTPDDDVWYRFNATQTYASISLNPGATLRTDEAMLQLYSGACGGLTSVACDRGALSVTGLTIGATYYVRVYSAAAYSTTPAVGPATNGFSILVVSPTTSNYTSSRMNEVYRQTVLSPADIIADPWEITYGPDDNLWITEAKGYKVFKMDPVTGARKTVLDVSQNSSFLPPGDIGFNCQFNNGAGAQGGFAGLALHPRFLAATSPVNYVYVAYVHSQTSSTVFTNRLVRFTYNPTTERLESPVSLCDTLPGSNDHNSQRIIIAPMTQGGTDYFLFYGSGDMGAGQGVNANIVRPIKSQFPNSYEGKILRFNLESDGDAGLSAWVPNNNPYNTILGVQSAVWNIGQRNNQGFAYNPELHILYGSSHGPYSDDEINILEGFRNYGHPLVIGYVADGNYDGSASTGSSTSISAGAPFSNALASSSSCIPIGSEATRRDQINATANGQYKDPLFSGYPGPLTGTGSVAAIWGAGSTPNNSSWPSEGWSGLDLYTHKLIPGWKNSIIASGLKWGRLIRLRLNATGDDVIETAGADTTTYFQSANRYRDLAFAPNGKDVYVSMDRSPASSTATIGNPPPVVTPCAGCIIKYEFLGYNATGTSPFPSTIPTSIRIDSSTNPGCVSGTAITINSANGNNNLWVPITGPNGDIIAEIDANNNNLGAVTTSFYTRTGSPARTAFANRYLNRNVTINVQNAPSSAVSVRLYLTAKELADMVATAGSGVTGINDIAVYKNTDPCGTAMASVATGQTITGRYTQSTYGHAIQFSVNSFSSFYFLSSSSTLPFDLFRFTGKAVDDASKLEWVVNNQTDVVSYTVERSLDNVTFQEIGTVDAKNSQSANITYNFTDFNAGKLGTVVYYRVHSNENSGVRKYTNTISINFNAMRDVFVNVFPNPVTEITSVSINAIADETAQLKVVDNTGRVVHMMNINLVKGTNTIQLDMSKFKAGLYYLDIQGKAINEKTKLIKQ